MIVHLLREVEKFLRSSNMPAARFGREAMGDPRFVFDLRKGVSRDREPSSGFAPFWRRRNDEAGLSPAAAGLLRALIARAGIDRDRILLTEFRSTDWQSLTFVGERHEMRAAGARAGRRAAGVAVTDGLEDAEFSIPGQIVADIALERPPIRNPDGSITLHIEALTIAE